MSGDIWKSDLEKCPKFKKVVKNVRHLEIWENVSEKTSARQLLPVIIMLKRNERKSANKCSADKIDLEKLLRNDFASIEMIMMFG